MGITYNANNKLWNKTDISPDYLYLGDIISDIHNFDYDLIYNYDTWLKTKSNKRCFPLIQFSDYLKGELIFSEKINFLKLRTEDLSQIKKIDSSNNFVLIVESRNDHFMPDMRSFFIHMNNLNCPILIYKSYNKKYSDDLIIHSSTDIGGLFIQGYGDGIFLKSNQNDIDEIKKVNDLSFKILQAARVRVTSTDFISCPSCGRTLFDLAETTAKIRDRTNHLKGLKIGIMGCIVNGPGEMADADYGYVGSGKDKITLYRGKDVVKRSINFNNGVDELIELIKEDGNWIEP